jgi:hypothetical protein
MSKHVNILQKKGMLIISNGLSKLTVAGEDHRQCNLPIDLSTTTDIVFLVSSTHIIYYN